MRLSMEHRRAIAGKLAEKYRGCGSRKERSRILDEVQELTGYERHYAGYLLRNYGKRRLLTDAEGCPVAVVVGQENKRRATDFIAAPPRACVARPSMIGLVGWTGNPARVVLCSTAHNF